MASKYSFDDFFYVMNFVEFICCTWIFYLYSKLNEYAVRGHNSAFLVFNIFLKGSILK